MSSPVHRNFTPTSLLLYDCAAGPSVSSPRDEGRRCNNASPLPLQFAGVSRPRIAGAGRHSSFHASARLRLARAGKKRGARFGMKAVEGLHVLRCAEGAWAHRDRDGAITRRTTFI